MSSILGAIILELYIQKYESLCILNDNVYKQYIKVNFKYVYDIFIFFNDTNRQVEVMASRIKK